MNDLLASLYELEFTYHNDFSSALYEQGAYTKLGLLMLLVPAILMAIFYFAWKYPFAKLWHWVISWVIGSIIVLGGTYGILNADLAQYVIDPDTFPEIDGFVFDLAFFNGALTLIVGFLISLVFKQFNYPHDHLPFGGKR